ncbi:hypothetical protein [Aureimonas sp. SK2]|uniref:hypothetical protein n=1 Tax=Aureimonas sp. SK2 TaxID=3015992 RepID=UPI0024441ECC|nr:hypothetical protein [Aureimonas sp. SK2]
MKTSLTAALVLFGTFGVASAALAAAPVHHPAHPSEAARSVPVKVMSETPNPNPGIAGVFQASDGVIYTPTVNDPRIHGLPNF